ncbi:protein BIG GRAIN 1-like E [Hibiscus syriacus]|uniref:protein BIG GRAIN 1-like E n=1 Tax=Hibiscus syriacus TaxID=106335 RepID=UPI001920A0DC|nr:protein BIG GRAIN 1-like E [Hibiscus syriacus]
MSKKAFRCRNGSGNLDVFEAAKYFSGYNGAASYNCATLISQKITRDERQPPKGGRISLDVPMRRNPLLQQSHPPEKRVNKEKKHKQPSSPGGQLASFLNSLFNQTRSRKKKNSKSSTTQSMKDEEESLGGGTRKRRMSFSHFRSSNTVDTKSFYSSSSYGFKTTPAKNNKGSDLLNEKKHDKSKFIDGILEKYKNLDTHHRDMNNRNVRVDRNESEEKGFRKFGEIDDGADSDSSSDLFELQRCDLGSYSSGLPVS